MDVLESSLKIPSYPIRITASVSLRKHLIETCNLEMVLDMPTGTFPGTGVKTVVLFFKKGTPTKSIWYYQLDPGRNLGKIIR